MNFLFSLIQIIFCFFLTIPYLDIELTLSHTRVVVVIAIVKFFFVLVLVKLLFFVCFSIGVVFVVVYP